MSDDRKREDVIRKVQALLDKAASTGFTAEAEALRSKADELMTKFIIEEHELRAAGSVADRETPATLDLRSFLSGGSPIKQQVIDLADSIARYCGCRIVIFGGRDVKSRLSFRVYGFKSELDYFELMLTSLMNQMAREMEPKFDPSKSVMENLDTIRGAGIGWERVVEIFKAHGISKSQTLDYRKSWLRAHPENRNAMPATYMRSFAQGFAWEVSLRLSALKRERNVKLSDSKAIVLVDRSAEVDSFFEEDNPNIRSLKPKEQNLLGAGLSRGREAGARADLGQSRVNTGRAGSITR